jgi:nucleoside-triphosphatase THEP1
VALRSAYRDKKVVGILCVFIREALKLIGWRIVDDRQKYGDAIKLRYKIGR